MFDDPPPEVVQSLMRLDARKLASERLEIRVFQSDDGFVYAYCEHGWIQGPLERLGPWK